MLTQLTLVVGTALQSGGAGHQSAVALSGNSDTPYPFSRTITSRIHVPAIAEPG